MATTAKETPAQVKNPFPWYAPRFWHGMPSKVWWPLLKRNHWHIDWQRLHFFASVSAYTPFTDFAAALQHVIYGRKIAATQLAGPPLFVLGHWRSGTTLLHELLRLDDNYGSPNTYQCFAPWHFMLTEGLVTRFGNFLLPDRRPMDNMKAGWKLPQEDEFALLALGLSSPYTKVAFPREDADIDSLSSETFRNSPDLAKWKETFAWFMKAITLCENKPLVLKSPTHTGRIQLLAEMYPDAHFVHISRHPNAMIPSTVRLWESLADVQALQVKCPAQNYEDFVFDSFTRMYGGYESGKSQVDPSRLIEISYESLVKSPLDTVHAIYDHLKLDGFDAVQPKLAERMNADKDYKTNRWNVPDALAHRIRNHCSDYCSRYGYEL